ncbi:MAG: PQQ-binding-like beta-propeller repeat protein [Hamadaea sp.]|uniref:outer membrane protein assembly factor BamB family protein n=1 Tax=Hamadaea sp. TaxID=2024425 RepID=UPI0017DE2D96|nr:PQQ-binding-like beta-propeller repeat protein [Hamadaea sp.]NUR71756.1 PQQ-binding-like beta-propeller repeat protein [Hamadaea sp.]NUT19070.1 PQQ-binding-like beta-propeller repeat protein [Hamadaea sp.]
MTLIDLDVAPPPADDDRPSRLHGVRAALRRQRLAVGGGLLLAIVLATQAGAAPGVPAIAPVRLPAVSADGPVLVSGDRAYVVTQKDFELRAYSLITGTQLWAYQSGRPIEDLRAVGDLVLVVSRQATRVVTDDGSVMRMEVTPGLTVALDGRRGTARWQRSGALASNAPSAGVVVMQDETGLVGVRADDGSEVWHDDSAHVYPAYAESPAVLAGTYLPMEDSSLGGRIQLSLLDVATGRSRLLGSVREAVVPILAVGSSAVLVYFGDKGVLTYGLAAVGSDPVAIMPITVVAPNAVPNATPDVIGDPRCGPLMCLTIDSDLVAVDPETRIAQWRRTTSWSHTQIELGGRVLLPVFQTTTAALVDAATGHVDVELGVWRVGGVLGDRLYTLYEPRRGGHAWLGVVDGSRVRAVADLGDARECQVASGWLFCAGDGKSAAKAWRVAGVR